MGKDDKLYAATVPGAQRPEQPIQISFLKREIMNPFFKRALVGLAGSAALVALAAATPAAASSLSVRFAWYMPPNTPTADQGNAIVKQIEADSKGTITVSTYPSGSLTNESRMGDAIANKTANMGIAAMHW